MSFFGLAPPLFGEPRSWNEFRDYLNNRSEAQVAVDDEEYQAFVSLYDKNNEVTARRRLCIFNSFRE